MDLNVKIKNLGKVAHAKVSIRPLTLITGCNSSGKSFITRGLYSILHTLNQDVVSAYILNVLSLTNSALLRLSDGIPRRSADDDALLSDIGLLLEGVRQSVADRLSPSPLYQPPASQLVLNDLKTAVAELARRLKVGKGTKMQAVKQHYTDIEDYLSDLEFCLSGDVGFYTEAVGRALHSAFSGNFQVADIKRLLSSDSANFSLGDGTEVSIRDKGLGFKLSAAMLGSLQSLKNVVYLESPVYYKMRNALKDARLFRLNMLRRGAVNPVPQYFYDLDEMLEAELPPVNEVFGQIADKVEALINGRLAVTPSGEIVYSERGRQSVPLNMASSGISNIGMIALLLRRNVLDEGSFLFIDEPEMNLHTSWQHAMLDILLDLSRAGVNVVVATHSLDMLHRLEAKVEADASLLGSVGVCRLSSDGISLEDGSVMSGLRVAKEVLGAPYLEVIEERLP
ncbi:TPA: AAA family ATPase [Neisseria meningitidis]|uniref:AAA family ATPase n=1 Tax=Neisseria meningitidis TaxID=487 RepID=UPI000C340AE2|nr:AAA family ATPase [Neisseria meningitidis]MBG9089890.1 AAA family ATPase [Neisseria meningitidis]MCE9735656.1 ATP-binding protein [Neisseria meningitidis]